MSSEPAPDALPASGSRPRVSILVPAFDEAVNMPDLFRETGAMLRESGLDAEIVLVDDGSTDGTLEAARRAAREAGLERVRFLRHRRNRGKTEALLTGARAAQGDFLVLFDADLQHAPTEIPRFVAQLESGFDMVVGRKVGRYEKRFVSGIYNWLARKIFGVPVHDLNAMKAFRHEVIEDLRLRSDWHRYLVVLAHARGYSMTEIDVDLHPRRHGISKYSGRGRIVVGTLDLLSVWFQLVFSRRPMLLFGVTGLFLVGAGALVGLVAVYLRLALHAGYRPMLTLVLLLVVMGLLLFAIGFLAELIASLRGEVDDLRRRLEERS
jgi:glycosyltransferase involved in cell wall biosynthesis